MPRPRLVMPSLLRRCTVCENVLGLRRHLQIDPDAPTSDKALAFLALPAFAGCSLPNKEIDVSYDRRVQPERRENCIKPGDRFVATKPLFVYPGRLMPTKVNDKHTPVL